MPRSFLFNTPAGATLVKSMKQRPTVRLRVLVPVLLILVIINVLLMARLVWPLYFPGAQTAPEAVEVSPAPSEPAAVALEDPQPTPMPSLAPDASLQDALRQQGAIVLSMQDGAYAHLFAYNPSYLPLTRLTNEAWDDIHPSISPDGTKLAFASRRSGFWDLYMLDMGSGDLVQLTSTADYDAAPTWSPDGEWLAYESYANGNLDIYLCSVSDLTQPPIRVTDDPAPDTAPDWSPAGRELAFVSSRSGEDEIWLLKLDSTTAERFTNLSRSAGSREASPAWSPDGSALAWSSEADGLETIQVWERAAQPGTTRPAGAGAQPAWSPAGNALLAQVRTPNQNGVALYGARDGLIEMPVEILPGEVRGMDWQHSTFGDGVLAALGRASNAQPAAVYETIFTRFPIAPAGRFAVVTLEDVQAPYPLLHDAVDEAFRALRQDVAARTGWDFLGNLENAFLPLTQPSAPGMEEDWLYTGRAFNANPVLTHAGWMVLVREDINGRTYWRVYLKARYQDGSQGMPLTRPAWDLDARFNGDAKVYEQGGQLAAIPEGYWVDFTELAGRYGWERQAALINWLTYYPAARFNQFVHREGLDWASAMAELYPPEALSASLVDGAQSPPATP